MAKEIGPEMMHICTTESFRAGINIPPFKCFMCGHKTMYTSWVDSRCDTCGACGEYASDIIRNVRQHTGLTRREIANLAGLKIGTIKAYEWKTPSKKYYAWFKSFIREFYNKR